MVRIAQDFVLKKKFKERKTSFTLVFLIPDYVVDLTSRCSSFDDNFGERKLGVLQKTYFKTIVLKYVFVFSLFI